MMTLVSAVPRRKTLSLFLGQLLKSDPPGPVFMRQIWRPEARGDIDRPCHTQPSEPVSHQVSTCAQPHLPTLGSHESLPPIEHLLIPSTQAANSRR
jgi:hypothetical protein